MSVRGGRGGGRPTTSLTQEQLVSMGIVGKDIGNSILSPPPIFPTTGSKPVPLEVCFFIANFLYMKEKKYSF